MQCLTMSTGKDKIMSNKLILPFVLIFVLLILTACSSTQGGANQPVTVNITADDFSFQASQTDFEVGVPYHFVVTNVGKVAHEMMIVPPIEPGTMDMEAMDEMALAHISEEELQPGTTQTTDYTFTEADASKQLEFACHVPGHYEAGMVLPITVK